MRGYTIGEKRRKKEKMEKTKPSGIFSTLTAKSDRSSFVVDEMKRGTSTEYLKKNIATIRAEQISFQCHNGIGTYKDSFFGQT